MSRKVVGWCLVIGMMVGFLAWQQRDSDLLGRWSRTVQSLPAAAGSLLPALGGEPKVRGVDAAKGADPKRIAGVRKCQAGGTGTISYTDGACPGGSRELTAGGGTLTVVPAEPAAARAAADKASASRITNIREDLLSPDDANLKERRMERLIGK